MFDKERYITRGVQTKIPNGLIDMVFSMIETFRKKGKLDYFQVFQITSKSNKDKYLYNVHHFQEEPQLDENIEIYILDEDFEGCKLYLIDDGPYCTLLLAEEY